jgi:RNA polymerase sigma factor (sigma-70 family)
MAESLTVMDGGRRKIVAWVGTHVMPHESAVRAWLRRSHVSADDIDDLIQEAYCKLAGLETIDHVVSADGYFFQIVRNLLLEQMRRSRVVQFETVAEMDGLAAASDAPSPERATGARRELEKVRKLIDALPERCRSIFVLRKIEGVSQREIAERLGVNESTVENDGVKGMRLIMQALREDEARFGASENTGKSRARTRRRD